MGKYNKEIIYLTSREILLTLFDVSTVFFEPSNIYRSAIRKYLNRRGIQRANAMERIRYLKRQGYIETFIEKKEQYIELTNKGVEKINKFAFEESRINQTKKWDKKWRVIIFDIPEKFKRERDIFSNKLTQLGLHRLQKSIFVYPFKCTEEIYRVTQRLNIEKYVLIMISEIIQGEEEVINNFIDHKVLSLSDLAKKSNS
ncbi:MAG: phenylacetic acid degradation operon negative regulatory protein [Candidatus Berkelbacteria bacterium Licking1014_85]|uniref:Phenylacetic acid degradation operon negative regulatory protein n=1 Tax=Candidatus Berkelbacteria bacterium Licking1014_85 TaxID=2017148 RepID=A0A554LH25_9BACT|nr:MAG: phenylacetic acid degradation operon negative regulatory protein [Candidatus Berkelbacteria bacterium Licking1014_85]